MGKFVMKCPICENNNKDVYVMVSGGLLNTGFGAKHKVVCPNGHKINTKTNRMAIRKCSHCGNNVVYDQSKGERAICPVCKTKINTLESNVTYVQIRCPQCGCLHSVAKNADSIECAVCNTIVDIQREISKKNMQKEHAVSLIKYEGDNNTFVWKHPIEDFKFGSQLIVHDSQEALFFCGGKALDLFPGGSYTLTTENIPLLGSIYKLPSGAETFHSEIFFINKTVHTGIKWGTSPRIRIADPYSGMYLSLGVNGTLNLQVIDSKRIVLKLVGTTYLLNHSDNMDDNLNDNYGRNSSNNVLTYIKSIIMTKVRAVIANVIKENGWSIFEIDSYIHLLIDQIKKQINIELEEYGLHIPDFNIVSISTPEDMIAETPAEKKEQELYIKIKQQRGSLFEQINDEKNRGEIAKVIQERKMIEAETEAKLRIIDAQGRAESRRATGLAEADVQKAQGFTGKDLLDFQVRKSFADNISNIGGSGSGSSTIGDLIGLGAGLGVVSKVSKQFGEMYDSAVDNTEPEKKGIDMWTCACGNTRAIGRFCNECGKPRPVENNSWTCECGMINTTKFCGGCGKPRPVENNSWTCECGTVNTTKFCGGCGKPRPVKNDSWTCKCGTVNTTKFCGGCGKSRDDN